MDVSVLTDASSESSSDAWSESESEVVPSSSDTFLFFFNFSALFTSHDEDFAICEFYIDKIDTYSSTPSPTSFSPIYLLSKVMETDSLIN